MSIESIKASFESDSSAQGHICYLNNSLFDLTIKKGLYGFPGADGITLTKIGVSGWRAIASLYNIGSTDLIFFYRTAGDVPGAQEFHGVFQLQAGKGCPLIFHPSDMAYMSPLQRDSQEQQLPFRFVFHNLLTTPVSIVNDIGSKSGKKNNNLEIIQAMSEINPSKPRLWGFRHPAVMNIGAAQKKSIVAITNKHALFLLHLMAKGKERPTPNTVPLTCDYNLASLPSDAAFLDDNFLGRHFSVYSQYDILDFEAEIYAFIIHALKDRRSVFHNPVFEQFAQINSDLQCSFEDISRNIILEMVPTPHIQETIDILLCDKKEENFLILEIKNKAVQKQDIEQTEKYVQLVKHQFPESKSVTANVIGAKSWANLPASNNVKVVEYQIESFGDSNAGLAFKTSNNQSV